VGVLLDWVPAHFPRDEWALARFDGTALYEHEDPRKGSHPDWGTLIFNFARHEVRNFLLANALYWVREFHVDGLRVDAVASMIYLDYSRERGDWVPNVHGGRENLEAVSFLQELNAVLHDREPGVSVTAEESTAWPGVSRPTDGGGLGFTFKWNMGWMHDTLAYVGQEPVHRRFHHDQLTFSLMYAWDENFVLPLSHDEVVHGKSSLLSKLPGDRWQKLATLRALYGYMWAHPGKQLLFMGGELGQWDEWSEGRSLDWPLLDDPDHAGLHGLVGDLNAAYRAEPALWEVDVRPEGFAWLVGDARDDNTLAFARFSADRSRTLVCLTNFSPVVREGWRLPLPRAGGWREVLNTDSRFYGGSDVGNGLGIAAREQGPGHGWAAEVTVPPLATVWLVPDA
jgi:1,4-alpha-glucan branching enzyme